MLLIQDTRHKTEDTPELSFTRSLPDDDDAAGTDACTSGSHSWGVALKMNSGADYLAEILGQNLIFTGQKYQFSTIYLTNSCRYSTLTLFIPTIDP